MTLSDLIPRLQALEAQHGNAPCGMRINGQWFAFTGLAVGPQPDTSPSRAVASLQTSVIFRTE